MMPRQNASNLGVCAVLFVLGAITSPRLHSLDGDLKCLKVIGIPSESDEEALRFPTDLLVNSAEEIYITDPANHKIIVFDKGGSFLRSIGRRGQGPLEYEYPCSLDRHGEIIWILDRTQRKIVQLAKNDVYLRTLRLDVNAVKLRFQKSGNMVVGVDGYQALLNSQDKKLIRILDSQGNLLFRFCEPVEYGDPRRNGIGNYYDFAIDDDDNVYVSFRSQNRIERYDVNGEIVFSKKRQLPYKDGFVDKSNPIKANVCSVGIDLDSKGHLWIVTPTRQLRQDEEVYQLITGKGANVNLIGRLNQSDQYSTDAFCLQRYDKEGNFLAQYRLGHYVDFIRIVHDIIYLADSERQQIIYAYQAY